jgi:asparagine synthase (glutamine-hydrolysing)
MCGIGGIFDLRYHKPIDTNRLLRMGAALARRGPDDEQIWQQNGVGLVHRRLSVIDPENGRQPMATDNNRVCIVFNGMIYNFQELRQHLESHGYRFKTKSDTEVILQGWLHWGVDLPEHLDGFFAIGIYDKQDHSLTLFRDRWGQKPLYYTVENQQLIFASDIPAITQAMSSTPKIRMDAFSDYITFGYVPEPKSIFETIYKLPPAHILRIEQGADCEPEITRYWSIQIHPQDTGQTLEDASQELNVLLEKAVRKRLIADVPLGAFLSGGLDSAAIVSTMASQMNPRDIHTCTMGFNDPALDERDLALITAARSDTNHFSECITSDTLLDIDEIATGFGEPFADPSALPTAYVSRLARRHMTVALSGDGGDELFAGYRRYPFHVREEHVKKYLPASIRSHVFGTLAKFYPRGRNLPRPLRAQATFEAIAGDAAQGLLRATCITTNADKQEILRSDLGLDGYNSQTVLTEHCVDAQTDDPLARAQYVDLMTWLPGRMLVKVDRASMMHGLEVRNPFLDIEVAEWAAKLPTRLKLDGFSGKRVLRHALAQKVSPEILKAPKRGFTPPIQFWMKEQLHERLKNIANTEWAQTYLKAETINHFISEQFENSVDRKTTLWSLLMFDAWYSKHVK